MEEREWIVSPKKLKENQKKVVNREEVEFEKTNLCKKSINALYFISGMMFVIFVIDIFA